MSKPVTIISCAVFRTEINRLLQSGEIPGRQIAINSMLHLYPEKLEKTLNKAVAIDENDKVILFGDCCPAMYEIADREGATLTQGQNCAEIYLGASRYKEEMFRGSFFLLPSWITRWREIFMEYLKLPEALSREMMQDCQNQFLYINTGLVPIPHDTLQEISRFFELSYEIVDVDIRDSLLTTMRNSLSRLGENDA